MRTNWTSGSASSSARRLRGRWFEREQFEGALFAFLEGFHLRAAALDAALLEDCGLVLFEGVEGVEEARGGKAEGGSGFAGGPDIDQAMERVLALLDALLVANGAGP
jgi:DMSO/TMAO reductase YedYZ molybdopterin-dependent catalytic subunit